MTNIRKLTILEKITRLRQGLIDYNSEYFSRNFITPKEFTDLLNIIEEMNKEIRYLQGWRE